MGIYLSLFQNKTSKSVMLINNYPGDWLSDLKHNRLSLCSRRFKDKKGFNKMKQRYTISTSLLNPIFGSQVLLIQITVHGWKWGIGFVFSLKKINSWFFIPVPTL